MQEGNAVAAGAERHEGRTCLAGVCGRPALSERSESNGMTADADACGTVMPVLSSPPFAGVNRPAWTGNYARVPCAWAS
jgi:hypothetical protein